MAHRHHVDLCSRATTHAGRMVRYVPVGLPVRASSGIVPTPRADMQTLAHQKWFRPMLCVLTPNPTVDRLLLVPAFRGADVCRINETRLAAGGKGINIVRVAGALGVAARSLAPLGGTAGQQIAALAAHEGLDARWHWLPAAESRTCVLVIDPDAPDTLVLNEHGPHLSQSDWRELADLVRSEAATADGFISAGSLPPGVEAGWFAGLLHTLLAQTIDVAVDTSGAALVAAIQLPLALLKVNAAELGAALGMAIAGPHDALLAAQAARRHGPRAVIVTLGSAGAVGVDGAGAWYAQPPVVPAISPVGSGDSFLAGVAVARLRGQPLPEALRLGAACGAANTLTIGSGIVRPADVEQIYAATSVTPLLPT